MGFFDFIRRKKVRTIEERLEINLENIDSWLKGETEKYFKDLNENSTRIIDGIQDVLKQLENDTKVLEKANVKEEKVDPRLLQIVLGNRKSLVNKINNFIDSIDFPKEINYRNVLVFYNSAVFKLNEFNRNSVQNYQQAEILFESESRKILESIKLLDNLLKEIGSLIKDKENLVDSVEETFNLIENLRMNISSEIRNDNEIRNQKSNLENLISIDKELENAIENLLKSEEWKRLGELDERNRIVEMQIEEIKNNIFNFVSPLEKSIKKFKNLIYSKEINFSDKELVSLYANNILETILNDDTLGNFEIILKSVKDSIEKNKIELKDEKRGKTISLINEILENNTLVDYIEKYKELNKQRNSIRADIEKLEIKEKGEVEKELNETKTKIKGIKDSLQVLENKTGNLKDEIEKDKSLIESKIKELTNKEARILTDNS